MYMYIPGASSSGGGANLRVTPLWFLVLPTYIYGCTCVAYSDCLCCCSAQILEKNKYRGKVEKIKTIGSTYMAATGLGENQV